MKKISPVLLLMSLFLTTCRTGETNELLKDVDLSKNSVFQKLLENPLVTIDGNFSAFIDTDTLYLLYSNPDMELSLPFQLQLISERDSVKNVLLKLQDYAMPSGFPEKLNPLKLGKIPLIARQIKALRVRQYLEESEISDQKRESIISLDQFIGNGKQECKPEISQRLSVLYRTVFLEHLNKGVFTSIAHGHSLLLYHNTCYVISKKGNRSVPNMMLHFIRKEGGFDNYSFRFEDPSFEACMEGFQNLIITKINLGKPFNHYKRIRIGEYGSDGNIWAQEYKIERLIENELLRYEGEFN